MDKLWINGRFYPIYPLEGVDLIDLMDLKEGKGCFWVDLSTVWQACPQFFSSFSENNILYYSIIQDLSNLSILSIEKRSNLERKKCAYFF